VCRRGREEERATRWKRIEALSFALAQKRRERKNVPDEKKDGGTLGDGGGLVGHLALKVEARDLGLAAVDGPDLFDSHVNVVVLGRL
jgi:hypothetical protein